MSTLKTNNAQIGQSATASNNFTWYQPTVPDGTVRLGQGNSGATTSDILVVSSTGLSIGGSSIPASRIVQGTAQATTSGTAVGFTGIPSWAKRITFMYSGVDATSASPVLQLGSGSYTTTGYNQIRLLFYNATVNQSTTYTSGFILGEAVYAGGFDPTGVIVLTLLSPSSNTWIAQGSVAATTTINYVYTTTGSVTLAGALDRIQLTVSSGAFNAGSVNIIYEG